MMYCKNKMNSKKRIKGFSLVELSIVLIIIGLLIAGVSSGSKLIGQAKLRSVITDYNTYKNAYNTFYLTYDVLPGDMSAADALAYFGVVNKSSNCISATASYAAEDNILLAIDEGPMAFWHLSLANLIGGNYDGEYLTAEVAGVTVGSANYADNVAFNFFSMGAHCNQWAYGSLTIYENAVKNILAFGAINTSASGLVYDSALKAVDAYSIDNKLDDGVPNSGIILADHGVDVGNSQQCTSLSGYASTYTSSDGTLSYMATNDYAACRMMFVMDF